MSQEELSSRRFDEAWEAAASSRDLAKRQTQPGASASYEWNLATDAVTWSGNLGDVIEGADYEAFATGLGYAEYLAAASTSSRYEAIMAGGCDTGAGVPFKVVYGLSKSARSNAAPVWVEDAGQWFADANGRPARVQGTIKIVTERYEAERLRTLAAQRDPVTDAFNKSHFTDHVSRYLTLSTRTHTTFGVVFADLIFMAAGSKIDNASIVDEAIAIVATRIRQQMRSSEALARYADTRFAMLLENCNGEQIAVAMTRLATAAEEAPIETSSGLVTVRLMAGGVIAPLHGRTPSTVLDLANEALAMARDPGNPRFVIYQPEQARTAAKQRLLQATDMIIAALNDGRVVVALQPVVDAKTRAMVFCEALVRIRAHDGSLIMPDVLVPAAEQGGLVALLDRRVVDLAFARLIANRHLHLSVNASVMSLHDAEWQQHFRAACALHPNAAKRLIVEITETCAIEDLEATREVLFMLKGHGIKVAIDDFGSGHSSFRHLRDLPIDYLKIDGAFARNFARSPDDRFFVRTLLDLAKNLRIPTIAEWVEDDATANTLTEWGIDLLQGHLFGKAEVETSQSDLIGIAV